MLVHPAVQRGEDQFVAGRVALVDGGQRRARAARDLAQLDRVVALGFEQLGDDVEDPVALHAGVVMARLDADHLLDTPLPSIE